MAAMKFEKLEDFYQVYDQHRTYVRAEVRRKHIRNFDEQFWTPAEVQTSHSVLELGTGTGLFLAYLLAKGCTDVAGVDGDPKVVEYMPDNVTACFTHGQIDSYLNSLDRKFDRIVLFDVFEHFSYFEGRELLVRLRKCLAPDGRITLRVPNAASPWGLQYQFNDLTHKALYGPGSIEHLAYAAGFGVRRLLSARRGGWLSRLAEDIVHGILNQMLTEPPPLWGANMIIVLEPLEETDSGASSGNI